MPIARPTRLRYNKTVNASWFDWFKPRRNATPAELVDGLDDEIRHGFGRPDRWLKDLILVAGRSPFELTPGQLARIAVGLSLERLEFDEDSAMGDISQQPIYASLLHYHKFFLACRQHAAEPLRWLLNRPPQGAGPMVSSNGLVANDTPVRGGKIIALEVLRRHGSDADLPVFGRLLSDLREDVWTRAAAGVALVRFGGAEAAERVVAACLDPRLPDRGGFDWFPTYAKSLAGAGASLVPVLIPLLAHRTYRLRHRAAVVLGAIGEPAVEALMEVIRSSDSFEAVENAELALRMCARRAIREARKQRAADERSLSIAEPPKPDAERGLSKPGPS